MRNLFVLVVIGVVLAGVGERLAKRLQSAGTPAAQSSAVATTGPSRDAAARPAQRPSPAQAGPDKLALRADRDGHFRVSALVNGRHMNFMVDTGATVIALTRRDADRLGIDARGPVALIKTANGNTTATSTRLKSVEIGDLSVRDVEAVIMPDGKLGENLLGMSFLSRLGRFEMRSGVLVLER